MIVDLRDYTLTPGCRDRMIEFFERVALDEQERLGATMLGSFLDADDPNRWVWLRACPDLDARKRILTAFYTDGALWKERRDEVNRWIVDSDNVLLLRPRSELAPPAQGDTTVGMYTHLGSAPPADATALDRDVRAAIAAAGGRPLVTFATDPAENNYPRHPIREGEHGLGWFATFAADRHRPLALASVAQRRLLPSATSRMR